MPNNESRLLAAKRLQKLGWALTRYGQRIERCCQNPSADHEKSASASLERSRERLNEFIRARNRLRANSRAHIQANRP